MGYREGEFKAGHAGGQVHNLRSKRTFAYVDFTAMIGRILLPERCANVCFGGPKRNRLCMAASQSIYVLYVETQGVVGG